ncbi:hypothetical protein CQA16_25240, partial [Enterobacter hormaechei]|uniref:hypothetical protein n=1 Tax=Enterobacter hormaechei TaxID=158836 RepID=UPI000BD48D2B
LRDRSEGLTIDRDGTSIAFGGEYALSKRTLVYGGTSAGNQIRPLQHRAAFQTTANLTLIGQVIRLRDRSEGLTIDRDGTSIAFGGEYALSKRTLVY